VRDSGEGRDRSFNLSERSAMAITMYDLCGAEANRRFSPFCWRTRMALAHKGLEVETIPWRFTEKDRIAFSGQGLVPVLVDGERGVVSDSWAIACHLEETYPDRPSLFGGPAGQALARFVASWTEAVVHPGISRLIILDIERCLAPQDLGYFRQSREARFGMTLEQWCAEPEAKLAAFRRDLHPLRMTLRTQPFLAGAAPGFADYVVFGAFQWARAVSPVRLLEKDDPVHAWRERMLDLFDGLARRSPGHEV
jgi:glutathione S-transferase